MKILSIIIKSLHICKDKVIAILTICHILFMNSNQYILLSNGIGDVIWFAAYYNSYLEYYSKKKAILITTEKFLPILEQFNISKNSIRVISTYKRNVTSELLQKMKHKGRIVDGQFFGEYIHIDHGLFNSREMKSTKWIEDNITIQRVGLEMDQIYKYCFFNLPVWVEPERLNVTNINYSIIKDYLNYYNIDKNTIILVPHANSRVNLPGYVWNDLTKNLKKDGYQVFTNTIGESDSPIPGSRQICVPLEYCGRIYREARCVVTARCGLADWLMYNNCNLLVLHYDYECNEDCYQTLTAYGDRMDMIQKRVGFNNQLVKDLVFSRKYGYLSIVDSIIHEIHNIKNFFDGL